MDTRTANLLRVLDGLAAEILLTLAEGSFSEKELLGKMRVGVTQSAVHKKLSKLEAVGLIHRPRVAKERGQPWSLSERVATLRMLESSIALSEALDVADRKARQEFRDRIDTLDKPRLRAVDT
jgi:DNA-binding transcriptional ArsR family regulator